MIKVVFCLRRLPHLSREEFRRYWREDHARLVKEHAETFKMVRYVQSHGVDDGIDDGLRRSRRAQAPYDGIAEVWYADRESFASLGQDPAVREADRTLREDEARFIDFSRSTIFVTEEIEILPG